MSIVEKAISYMEAIAADNSHGYDQARRWGPDYDCSSLVITAWQQAGVPVMDRGAITTRNMYSVFTACGFVDVTAKVDRGSGSGLLRGDVLLNHRDHVAMYCGNGKEVEASINEFGGVVGGQTGDQGNEILVRDYRNYPWDCVLRWPEDPNKCTFTVEVLRAGQTGVNVFRLQSILKARGFYTGKVDYSFGEQTRSALKSFQKVASLPVTGECDVATWDTLLGLPRSGMTYTVEARKWRLKREADVNVLLVQEILKAAGYYTGALTWNFNRPLQAALKTFQRAAKKLEVNGESDVPTLRWMLGE